MPSVNEMPIIPDLDIRTATGDQYLEVGMQYSLGRGVRQCNVKAHMWFNIAASRGCHVARQYRHELSQEMSQSEIAEAQRQARAWLTLH
jgi:TPR repeat protein